jgi:lipopolysaccharide export LptBFGC system permease protein LptF
MYCHAMRNRTSTLNLVVSLAAFFVVMLLLPAALGAGIGPPELAVWVVLLLVGSWLIVRRYRAARRGD